MYRLVFQSGRYQGKRLVVRQAVTVVGREADCHLVLSDDDQVAPRHARFEARGTGVFLSNLSAEHPVARNGQLVLEPVRLVHDDLLVIGQTRIQFQDLIVAPARLRTSPGILQPLAGLLAASIVVLELLLLAFLVHWPARLIQPDTEAADIASAEVIRAERAAKNNAETGGVAKAASAASASVVILPGTAPAAASTSEKAAAAATPSNTTPSAPASPIAQMLDDAAAFEPANTNTLIAGLPPISAADPSIERAQRLLAEAAAAAQFADSAKALRLLNQIHQENPGFLPAHVEHARLLEARGDLDAAQQRWKQILGIAPAGSPFRPQAIEERQRLATLQSLQTRILQAGEDLDLTTLPRNVRFLDPAIQKSPPDADIAEMRVLDGTLELAPGGNLSPNAVLQVFITFYDSDTNDHIRVTRALVPASPLVLGNALADRRRVDFDATYVVPRGLREKELRETGSAFSFYGFTLHVFAGQILQDAFARPKKLLDLPIHFPAPED